MGAVRSGVALDSFRIEHELHRLKQSKDIEEHARPNLWRKGFMWWMPGWFFLAHNSVFCNEICAYQGTQRHPWKSASLSIVVYIDSHPVIWSYVHDIYLVVACPPRRLRPSHHHPTSVNSIFFLYPCRKVPSPNTSRLSWRLKNGMVSSKDSTNIPCVPWKKALSPSETKLTLSWFGAWSFQSVGR